MIEFPGSTTVLKIKTKGIMVDRESNVFIGSRLLKIGKENKWFKA